MTPSSWLFRGFCAGRVIGCVAFGVVLTSLLAANGWAQEAVSSQEGPYAQPPAQEPAPVVRQAPETPPAAGQQTDAAAQAPLAPLANYDPALFQRRIPKEQLAFVSQYAGAPSNELYREKQFRKLMHSFVPDCTFHYGMDKSMFDALDEVIQGSSEPVQIRDGRYLLVSGHMGKYLAGRAFLWIDLQEGIGLGGFYFHPTNGEPTPAMNVFSKQVQKEMLLDMSELPPAFNEDMTAWTQADNVPPLTTRYFITGSNKKILLEHDEDFCAPASGAGYNDCEQMNADAADMDMTAAGYLEQTHHATNATAWMITDPDQVAWLQVRVHACGGVLDPLGCRITMARERTRVILHAPPPHPVGRPVRR
jgi:hypothetical protein